VAVRPCGTCPGGITGVGDAEAATALVAAVPVAELVLDPPQPVTAVAAITPATIQRTTGR
jgi:hypothetical protein